MTMNPLSSKVHFLAQTRQTKRRTNRTENHHEQIRRQSLAHAQTFFSSVSSKMISSPYCAVSEPNVYKHYKRLARWNANRCHSLRITYLIFETFQTLFPTSSLIFTAVKVSSSDISERMKHKSFASKMAVDMKL